MHRRIVTAALMALALAGCGGSGTSTTSPGTGVSGSINAPVYDSTSPGAVNSPAGSPTPVTLTVNGQTETDAVPGGENIPAGSQVLMIPATLPVDIWQAPGSLGEIFFVENGTNVDTGLHVYQGQIATASNKVYPHYALAYPAAGSQRTIEVLAEGPVQVGTGPSILSLSTGVYFTFEISKGGNLGPGNQTTYPTGSLYALPANGTTLYESFMTLYLGRLNASPAVPATMHLAWPGIDKTQTRLTTGGKTTLWAADAHLSDAIPAGGISSANMSIVP